jgi:hypothetical protein
MFGLYDFFGTEYYQFAGDCCRVYFNCPAVVILFLFARNSFFKALVEARLKVEIGICFMVQVFHLYGMVTTEFSINHLLLFNC